MDTLATAGADGPGPGAVAKLALEHLTYAVAAAGGRRAIVDDVSFEVRPGKVFTIVGPSGSGKSSVLRATDRLIEPTGGRVLLDGGPADALPVPELRRRVGMVFQAPVLFDGTVLDNVAYGPRLRGKLAGRSGREAARGGEDEVRELTCGLLGRVGLPPDFCSKPAEQLSGGEAQRVCLARALANHPEVLLLDEPTASLDPAAARRIEELLLRLAAETDLTFVFVTHDLRQARRVGDHGLLLVDGRVVEQGPLPDLFDRPGDLATQLFLEGRLGEGSSS
jgi:putative ABC transport system ATP-binding protein